MRPVAVRTRALVARQFKAHVAHTPSSTRVSCASEYNERLITAADASDAVTALEVLTEVCLQLALQCVLRAAVLLPTHVFSHSHFLFPVGASYV